MSLTLTVFNFYYGKALFYKEGLRFRFNDNFGFKCSKTCLKSICSYVFSLPIRMGLYFPSILHFAKGVLV